MIVFFSVNKNNGLWEYDIRLTYSDRAKTVGKDENHIAFGTSVDLSRLWPGGILYYEYDEHVGKSLLEKSVC